MTSERIFQALADRLSLLVREDRGVFTPSQTVEETMSLLSQAPGSWRCILQWQREDPTGERGEMRMKVLLIVQAARGLDVRTGADAMPLLARFNKAAAWIRAVYFDNTDIAREPWQQGATQWLVSPDFPTRQISGEFSLRYGLSAVDLVKLTVS